MGRDTFSHTSYKRVADKAKAAGSATFAGEERRRKGEKIHDLVDPAGYGLIRRSRGPRELVNGKYQLLRGVAMLEETRLDTTGSMGNNVEIAMRVLPRTYDLLAKGGGPVLGRYDTQMITSIFGDAFSDEYVLFRSQAEMDERIAEQMTYMVPEGNGGGNGGEDPQYGLFAAAYLTEAEINKYGLKSYDFTITDEPCRIKLNEATLHRVFGETVFDKVKENGHNIDPNELPTTNQVVKDLQKKSHAFMLIVQGWHDIYDFWVNIYGEDHVVVLPRVELLPEVKACIIGLTEGVLDLSSLDEYLESIGDLSQSDRDAIRDAVSVIPVGAQMENENFEKIPVKGDLFETQDSLWPVGHISEEDSSGNTEAPDTKDKIWN